MFLLLYNHKEPMKMILLLEFTGLSTAMPHLRYGRAVGTRSKVLAWLRVQRSLNYGPLFFRKLVYNGIKDSELLGDHGIYFGVELPRMMRGVAPPSRSVPTAPARSEQQTSCLRLGVKLPEEQCMCMYIHIQTHIHTPTHRVSCLWQLSSQTFT